MVNTRQIQSAMHAEPVTWINRARVWMKSDILRRCADVLPLL
jgi:hypothetical protein